MCAIIDDCDNAYQSTYYLLTSCYSYIVTLFTNNHYFILLYFM